MGGVIASSRSHDALHSDLSSLDTLQVTTHQILDPTPDPLSRHTFAATFLAPLICRPTYHIWQEIRRAREMTEQTMRSLEHQLVAERLKCRMLQVAVIHVLLRKDGPSRTIINLPLRTAT